MAQHHWFVGLSLLGTLLLPLEAPAQERDGCFFITGSGSTLDLGHLCEGQTPEEILDAARSQQRSPSTATTAEGSFEIPINRRLANVPAVNVTFNGRTYEMLFDTGASGTVITQRMAAELGVIPEGRAFVNTASQRNVPIDLGRVATIEVGGLQQNNTVVAIAGPELDMGLLGQDIFGAYDVTIRANVIELQAR